MYMNEEIVIIMPAYNESASIYNVIKSALKYGDVLVLNDASTDNTKYISEKAGAKVISQKKNLGYEGNLSVGFKYVIKNTNYKYMITIDADGEHKPLSIVSFINAFEQGANLVCGKRNFKNRFFEHIWSIFGMILYRLDDPLCGMKGYDIEFIRKKNIEFKCDFLGKIIGTYLAKTMMKNNCQVKNIPINVLKRNGESKFGSGFKINIILLKELKKFIMD